MYRQTLLRPPRSSWASNSCCSTSLLDREDQQTREVALELYAQHMYRSHLTESMETIFAKTFSSRRLLSTRWWFGVAPAEGYDDLANLL